MSRDSWECMDIHDIWYHVCKYVGMDTFRICASMGIRICNDRSWYVERPSKTSSILQL